MQHVLHVVKTAHNLPLYILLRFCFGCFVVGGDGVLFGGWGFLVFVEVGGGGGGGGRMHKLG